MRFASELVLQTYMYSHTRSVPAPAPHIWKDGCRRTSSPEGYVRC